MKVFQKISIRLVLLQILFLYLFSQAASHFYYVLNYQIYECFYINDLESGRQCFEQYPGYSFSELFAGPIHFMLYGLLTGAVIITCINWRKKYHILNLLAVLVLYILLFFSGVFKITKDLDTFLLAFGRIFSNKFWVMNLVAVHTYLVSGFILVWLSVKRKTESGNPK